MRPKPSNGTPMRSITPPELSRRGPESFLTLATRDVIGSRSAGTVRSREHAQRIAPDQDARAGMEAGPTAAGRALALAKRVPVALRESTILNRRAPDAPSGLAASVSGGCWLA
jgi:hypothetical protein